MARIRTIKPEFWTSEQIMDCKPVTRLLFIGLWNFVDDFGRCPVAPRTIKAQVMPGDDFSGDDIQGMLNELCSSGLILFYAVGGKEYLEITGWSKHQKIDNPSKYKVCPAPFSEELKPIAIPSEESPKIGLEGKGEERKGEEKKALEPAAKTRPRANEAFERFKATYPRREGANPWQPAEKKFNTLVKSGVDPEIMISAALELAREETARGNIGTKFIPQAITWLNQQRFTDYAAASFTAATSSKYYAKAGSEQLEAWDSHSRTATGKTLPRDKLQGWLVDTEWPPDYVPLERSAAGIPTPSLKSMQ